MPVCHNGGMEKIHPKDRLIANLLRFMAQRPGMETPAGLARHCYWPSGTKKGKRVSPRIIRYVFETEEVNERTPSPTLDLIEAMSRALGIEAWELLVDEERTRSQILAKIIGAHGPTDDYVAAHIPAAPQTRKQKKASGLESEDIAKLTDDLSVIDRAKVYGIAWRLHEEARATSSAASGDGKPAQSPHAQVASAPPRAGTADEPNQQSNLSRQERSRGTFVKGGSRGRKS